METKSSSSVESIYPTRIPKDYFKYIESSDALKKQFIASDIELNQKGFDDPIGDKENLVAPQLIHRYENRVLFTPTNICPINCRYCFRKNELYSDDPIFEKDFDKTIQYLKDHTEINEIIFTGGDPLVLSDKKIEEYLNAFSEIKHIKYIRFHTRVPVITPERITHTLIDMLKSFEKFNIKVVIHTNHSDELTYEAKQSINLLYKNRVEMLSQSVLLKDVNDNPQTLKDLIINLVDLGIRPYYLHHPDKVKGGMHFYLTLEEGRKIYSKLKNHLSGWMLPKYVVDIEGGHGKTNAFNPENFSFSGKLINKDGRIVSHS